MLEKLASKIKIACLRQYLLPAAVLVLSSCTAGPVLQVAGDSKAQAAGDCREYAVVNAENGKTATVAVVTGERASYPGDLPFAQYPGSLVMLNLVRTDSAGESVTLETADPPDSIVGYYRNWFMKNGWMIDQESSTSGLAAISARRADKLASIMSMPGTGKQGKSSIQITLSSGK
jgi:hypothetical protein